MTQSAAEMARVMRSSEMIPSGFKERFEQVQQEMYELQRNIENLTETAHSEDRLISATVGARGELRELHLDPRIYRSTDASKLAADISETIWDATRAVTTKLIELTQPFMPEEQAKAALENALSHIPAKGSALNG